MLSWKRCVHSASIHRSCGVDLPHGIGAGEVLLGNYARGQNYLLGCLPHLQAAKERAFALLYLGQAAAESGELALARTQLEESLAISRQCNDFAGMSQALHMLQVGRPMVEAQRLAAKVWHAHAKQDVLT